MRTRFASPLTVLIAAGALASCATQAPMTSQQSAVSARTSSTAAAPTFYADVLPVLQENCQVCHVENGLDLGGMIAPMAFVTYDETRRYASRIARAVESGYMPPWSAAPEEHGVFKNERVLADQDKATLLAWARGGTPAGDPADAPAPKHFASSETGWAIGEWETNGTPQGASGISDSTTSLYLRLERISCPSCSLIQYCPLAGPETETIWSRFTITERWTRANAPPPNNLS